MNQIKDIMISASDYSVVNQKSTIGEAIKVLRSSFSLDEKGISQGHTSLVVINDNNELVGVLTVRSILKSLIIHKKEELPDNYLWVLFTETVPKSAALIQVEKVMRSSNLIHVDVNEDIMRAVNLIVTKEVNTIPVLEKGKLVGLVRSKDIFDIIGELL